MVSSLLSISAGNCTENSRENKLNYYLIWNKLLAPYSKRKAGALFRAEECALVRAQ